MAYHPRPTIDAKKTFIELRAQGATIKAASKAIGVCVATGSKLERHRTSGALQTEILTAENPQHGKDIAQLAYVLDLIDQCNEEIATRNIGLLTTPKLIGTLKHCVDVAQKLKKSLGMNNSTAKSEPDDLDEIWSQVARAEGPK
jgi:hypothetical protein